jgi:iron complex transport system permease protein
MKENSLKFLLLLLICFTLIIADILIGTTGVLPFASFINIFTESDSWQSELILSFRLPKTIVAILAGISLSVSGLQMQTLFRNPMAGPYVLGISSGASLGVAIVVLGFSGFFIADGFGYLSNWAIAIASWLGSGLILFIVFAVSIRIKDIMTVLILGILFASITSAIVGILQFFSSDNLVKAFVVWTMGSLGSITWSQLQVLIPAVVIGLTISFICIKPLNILLLGEEYAKTVGINSMLVRYLIFIGTSLLAGTITAFCGPIGFIGIAVPHLARMFFKTHNHKILIPGVMLIGTIVLLLSDLITQFPGINGVLPINSITALLGIPIIIWIIIKNQRFSESI